MARLKSPRTVVLTAKERAELESWTRATKLAAGKVRRARIILLAADGMEIRKIVQVVGVQRNVVRKWLDRFRKHGLDGLFDLPRPGRPVAFSPSGDD